jgi:predicted dehydrogenase
VAPLERGRAYWRGFEDVGGADLRWLYVSDGARRRDTQASFEELVCDEALDGVVVAEPAGAADLVGAALEADKHVLIDRAPVLPVDVAAALAEHAQRRARCIVVGHPLVFHPVTQQLKSLVDSGDLGEPYYVTASSDGSSEGRDQEPSLWPAAAELVSVVMHVLGDTPVGAAAHAESYVDPTVVDTASFFLRFATGITADLRLAPLERDVPLRMAVVCSRGVAVLAAGAGVPRLLAYDRGAKLRDGLHGRVLRTDGEPLVSLGGLCSHFLATARAGRPTAAERILSTTAAVLDALERSADAGGVPEELLPPLALEPPVALAAVPDG